MMLTEVPDWAKPKLIDGKEYLFLPKLNMQIKRTALRPGKANNSVLLLQQIINFLLEEDIDFGDETGKYDSLTISGLQQVKMSRVGILDNFTDEEFEYFLEDFGIELV